MRLRRISISDFGGFPQTEVIELDRQGMNLLVYGENGSGKSTIFTAIDSFFRSSLESNDITGQRNLFLKQNDPDRPLNVHVKLLFGPLVDGEVQVVATNNYEWTDGSIPTASQVVRSTAQLPSRLDYRAILATHFIHRAFPQVDLYGLLVTSLLPSFKNPVSNTPVEAERRQLLEDAEALKDERDDPTNAALEAKLKQDLEDHNSGLDQLCTAIQSDIRRFLKFFKDGQSIELKVIKGVYDGDARTLRLPEVQLIATLHRKRIPSHHVVINEARLTSIGLCIYLAALKHQASTLDGLQVPHLKLLVLDDVLIGLDIANRYPVLQILRKEFVNWQIILLTYDRIWFDMVVETIDIKNWRVYEAYKAFDVKSGYDRPRLVPRLPNATQTKDHLLARANELLAANDFRGAAVYARAAFEVWAKKKADKHINVKYYKEQWRQPINDLWQAIKLNVSPTDATRQASILALETSKAIVLNPWSHASGSAVVAADVQAAITAVANLW